jgi:hypothetical protein
MHKETSHFFNRKQSSSLKVFAGKLKTACLVSLPLFYLPNIFRLNFWSCESQLSAVLPDGIVSNKKSKFGCTYFGGFVMENFGKIYGHLEQVFDSHLVHIIAIWYILWYIFPVLVCTKKNLATLAGRIE